MLAPSGRVLRLLTLLQGRAAWSGAELAERLEITSRTLRRDVDRLRQLGYPVDATSGVSGGYALGRGAALPPLSLDADEATAVFVGLHVAAGTTVTGANTAAMRALTKLRRVLPARLRDGLRALESAVIGLPVRPRSLSLSALTTLARACVERRVTRVAYRDRKGSESERSTEPIRVVRVGEVWYLVAWDRGRSDWRTLRLDRMEAVEALDERFAARPPPDSDLAAWATRAISASPHRYRARVRLLAPIEEIRPRIGAFDALLLPEHHGCIMELGAPTFDVLAARVMWLGVDFELLDAPPHFAPHLGRLADRLGRAADSARVVS